MVTKKTHLIEGMHVLLGGRERGAQMKGDVIMCKESEQVERGQKKSKETLMENVSRL